ncbi:BTAD domain-containing putative transcriptional regulator [Streptosporangium soli]|nr:AAA family ATPase [Streptosporangium sp. KLBMP 9127]
MRFDILGPLEVRTADGEPVPVGGRLTRSLLVLLLLEAGRTVSVHRLVDVQYGERPPAGAANALQAQVSRLRRRLPAGLVEFHGAGYRLAIDPDDVDAHRFERLAAEGRRLLAAGHHAPAGALLGEAVTLWRGPALTDLTDTPYARAELERLEELRLTATEDHIETKLASAELALPGESVVPVLRRLVAANPMRERLHGQLMRALHAEGRQAEALEVFAGIRRLLAGELGADPSPELSAIHLALLRGERPAHSRSVRPDPARPAPPDPATRPGRTALSGLAAQLTSFVGRESELARIGSGETARLLTITGPGGTGKTRLAVEAAGRQEREVCFAELSPLDAGEQVPQAVLSALGLRETGLQVLAARGPAPADRLVTALAERETLLILDNCEHVVDAAAALARRLLDSCPGLVILATSREPLGITGETLVRLPPLEVPPPDLPPEAALTYPAVRLFADRASAVRHGFAVEAGNLAAVVGICAALDGVPLAIELAAARLRSFTVAEIARRLPEGGRFRLLSRGDRTAAARHQTLHAVVEWSWELLTPPEQVLARRFAVFSGGATLEAVERVCGLGGPSDAIAGLLADLVDKSLVETDGDRYRMLTTIRLFCDERLARAGEAERARAAHAAYFLDLAERAAPQLHGAEQLHWLGRLSAEHSNLRAALRWSVTDAPVTALRLIAELAAYWWLGGRRTQVVPVATRLLEVIDAAPAGWVAAEGEEIDTAPAGWVAAAGLEEEYVLCVLHAVPNVPPEHWRRAETIVRSLDRPMRNPFATALWGMTAGPDDRAPRIGADPWSRALAGLGSALLKLFGGEVAAAEREFETVLRSFRSLGERWGTAQALDWLAEIASWRGDGERSADLWREALDLLGRLGATEEMVDMLCRQARGLVRTGALGAAAAGYRRGAEFARRAGIPGTPVEVELGLAEIARLNGDFPEAHRRLATVPYDDETGPFGARTLSLQALTARGRLAEAEGDVEEAGRWHRRALVAARRTTLLLELAEVAEGQAGGALLDGAAERAAALLGLGMALRGTSVTGDPDVARVAAGVRDLIGGEAFAAAHSRGAAMTRDQALTFLGHSTPAH